MVACEECAPAGYKVVCIHPGVACVDAGKWPGGLSILNGLVEDITYERIILVTLRFVLASTWTF